MTDLAQTARNWLPASQRADGVAIEEQSGRWEGESHRPAPSSGSRSMAPFDPRGVSDLAFGPPTAASAGGQKAAFADLLELAATAWGITPTADSIRDAQDGNYVPAVMAVLSLAPAGKIAQSLWTLKRLVGRINRSLVRVLEKRVQGTHHLNDTNPERRMRSLGAIAMPERTAHLYFGEPREPVLVTIREYHTPQAVYFHFYREGELISTTSVDARIDGFARMRVLRQLLMDDIRATLE